MFKLDPETKSECGCRTACSRKDYIPSVSTQSLSKWSRDGIANAAVAAYNPGCFDGTLDDTVETCTAEYWSTYVDENFVQLEVFFASFMSEEIELKVGYTILALLCDIGGALGLILGSTVLTVFEFLDFFIIALTRCALIKASNRINKVTQVDAKNKW